MVLVLVMTLPLTDPTHGSNEASPARHSTEDAKDSLQSFLDFAIDAAKESGRHIPASSTYSIVETMNIHPLDVTVQQTGCRVLRYLAQHENHRHHIRAAGGIAAVLAAMELHIQEETIQVKCNYALANLATTNTKNRRMIVALNGANTIVAAMNRHWSSVTVQTSGCNALAGLDQDAYGHRAVIKAKGFQAIRRAISREQRDPLDNPKSICVAAEASLCRSEWHRATRGRKQDGPDVLHSVWKFTRASALVARDVTKVSASLAWDVTRISALISTRVLRNIWRALTLM